MEHAKAGFQVLGHDVDIVTFTKSGKRRITWGDDGMRLGMSWWRSEPDVVAKTRDAADVLNSYDFILLTEPKHMTLDREATKAGDGTLPYYVEALRKVTKPWTAVLCGPLFQEDRAPFIPELLESPGLKTFVASGPDCAITSPFLNPETVPIVSYPYQPQLAVTDPVPFRPIVGMTGRIVPNKGPAFLAHAITDDRWTVPLNVELHGSASIGTGPNFTFLIWEHLLEHGWAGERIVPEKYRRIGPDVLRPWPFISENPAQTKSVEYLGGFNDAVATAQRMGIYVGLTDSRYSSGVEFALLEAIDAGCYPILLEHLAVQPWIMAVLPYVGPPSMTRLNKQQDPEKLDALLGAVQHGHDMTSNDAQRRHISEFNRQLLRELHDPSRWCGNLLAVAR